MPDRSASLIFSLIPYIYPWAFIIHARKGDFGQTFLRIQRSNSFVFMVIEVLRKNFVWSLEFLLKTSFRKQSNWGKFQSTAQPN